MAGPWIFDQVRYFAGRGFDFEAGDVTLMLVDRTLWTPDITADGVVADILGAGAVDAGDRVVATNTVVSVVSNRAIWDIDDYNHTGVANLQAYDTLVAYNFITDDSDSWLIAAQDLGAQVGDGSPQAMSLPDPYLIRW